MSLERPTDGKREHKEDNFDSFSYQRLDNLICSDKENVKAFDNIDDLVDSILAKSKFTSYERHVKGIKRIRSFDKKHSAKRPKSYGSVGSISGMSDLVSVKKLFSIVLSFVLLFAVLASASSFVDPDLDGATVNPEDMLVEDTLSSNATIPDINHTDDTGDDEPHLDNSTLSSDQNGTVTADNENMINETGDTIDNDTLMGENESLNVTNPPDNQTSNILDNTTGYDNVSINVTTNESIDVSTTDGNQSAYATHLNITLNTDKNSYLVNETVFINGTVVFNNSFVETTVNLSINSSDSSFLYIINTTNGTFSYEYIASKSGSYIIGAHAIFENETASINTLFIVNDITDETDDVTVLSLIQGEAVVGESVFWEKKIMVKNNASIQRTLNIATTIPDTASNIKIQDVLGENEVNYTVLVNQIAENNVSEQISSSTSIMFNRTFDAWGEREFIITYETPPPIKQEISYDGGKRIEIQSNATVHYSNITAYTELPELSYKPRFYRVINGTRVDVTFDPLYNVTYLDNNSNGKYDGISWNVPRLSNDTYEIVIVITKAAHLDENRELISDIYDEVYRKDGVWSEPIYHDEYVRVTFEQNLTERNDITFYARNNQSLNTIVEVYYYDSDEKITEFPIIEQEDFYKVYLTGMEGSHQIFDLKMKNLDNKNSAYLEFDYIVDPDTMDAVDSNVTDMDGSADVGIETNFQNAQDTSPNSNYMNIQENNTGTAGVNEWLSAIDLDEADEIVDDWTEVNNGDPEYITVADDDEGHAGSYITLPKFNAKTEGWFNFSDTTETGDGFSVNFSFRVDSTDGDADGFYVYYNTTGTGAGAQIATPIEIQSTTYIYRTVSIPVTTFSATEINNMRIWLDSATNDDIYVDYIRMGISRAGASTNYKIDFEYNWSTADFDETNEEVCFYVGGSFPSENLNVSYWTGSSWSYLGEITGIEWTNLTATGLTDATYEIRVNGTVETSDTTQDDWDIDVIMLHTWPTISTPTVTTNTSTGVEETTATIWGFLESNGSADTICWFLWDTDNDYANNETQGVKANRSEFSKGLTTLISGDLYYFNTKANNSAGWDNSGGELTFFTKPEAPDSITSTTVNGTNASFSVDKADMGSGATSYTYARYNTGSAPTTRAEGSLGFNSTSDIPKITGLSAGTHYYGSAWAWGEESSTGQYSDTYITFEFNTSNYPVVITNASTGVEETNATLRGYLQSNGSADTYTYLLWDNDASGEPYAGNQSNGLTANLSEFQYDATSLTSGDLYYFNTKANNSAGWDNSGGELTFFTKPPAVTSLAESSSTNTSLTYTWTEATVGTDATAYTRIQYKTGSNPTSITDGTNTYNGTDETDDTTGLEPGTHYYFSAFSWGTEGGIGNWNDAYDTMDAWTNPGDPTSVSTTNGSTWINVTFTHGQNGDYTMVRRNASGSAAFPSGRASGTLVDNTTDTYANDTGLLAMGVTYYYALWTWDTDGGKWCDYQTNITGITWNLSINATPSQWNLGNVWVGGSNTSADYYFNITNEGNATLNIQIKASNATNTTTGARWNLTATPDHNDFTLHYDKSGDGGWTIINTTYDVFVTSLGVDSEQTFDLKMTHATTSSVIDPMSLTVTFKSVVS